MDFYDKRVIGITGNMGSGKTTLAEKTWILLDDMGQKTKLILVDNLRYALLCGEAHEPDEFAAKRELSRRLEIPLLGGDEFYFPEISAAILRSRESMMIFREVACPVLVQTAKRLIDEHDGLTLIEGSALLEEGFGVLLDNPLFLAYCEPDENIRRLAVRDAGRFTQHETNQRLARQPTVEERMQLAGELGVQMEQLDTSTDEIHCSVLRIITEFQRKMPLLPSL